MVRKIRYIWRNGFKQPQSGLTITYLQDNYLFADVGITYWGNSSWLPDLFDYLEATQIINYV